MNPVGKKFRLLLLLGGLVCASLAFPGRTAAQDPSEMKHELDNVRKLNDQLKARLAKLEATLAETLQVSANLQAQSQRLKAENEQLRKELAQHAQQEAEALRQQLQQVEADRDKNLRSVVELTDQLNKAFNEISQLKAENARLTALLPAPPPKVLEGVVTATHEDGLMEISLGADDGLKPGHQLSVCRAEGNALKVLGRLVVVKTAPDKAVCRVRPESLKAAIRNGDRVTTAESPPQPSPTEPPKAGEPPMLIGGLVLAVHKDRQVEISFGAADGLRPGHRLEVYRETGELGIYVGRIEVVETSPKKSLCKIISEMDTVREGDRITSKL
jgi:hypothetical protein